MKQRIVRFLVWLLRKLDAEAVLYCSLDARKMLPSAILLTGELEVKHEKQTGEWKRHQAYAALLKRFPGVDKRDASIAIELALQ
jgi:hypothetical protein